VIVLDTNVVSELMRPQPEPVVLAWAASRLRAELFTTSITKAEIFYGIALLPQGRRKTILIEGAERIFGVSFADRVLAFDTAAAERYGDVAMKRRRAGKPISALDAQIAAIALSADAVVATRDVDDFQDCGLEIVNPWIVA